MSEILTREQVTEHWSRLIRLMKDGKPLHSSHSAVALHDSHFALLDALAAANARIAVLEAERDGLRERDMRVQMIAVPLGKVLNTDEHLRQLWRQYDDDGSVDESVITTALGDLAGAIDELYDACYDTVHAHRAPHERNPARAATASPEPGAAHE